MKNILFASSECVPFIKTGGLADVVGSLPKEFDKEKYDVRVVLPKYTCMKQEWKDKLEYVTHFYMDIAGQNQYVGVMKQFLMTLRSILLTTNTISAVSRHMMEIRSGISRSSRFSQKRL